MRIWMMLDGWVESMFGSMDLYHEAGDTCHQRNSVYPFSSRRSVVFGVVWMQIQDGPWLVPLLYELCVSFVCWVKFHQKSVSALGLVHLWVSWQRLTFD
jgi:hypothetical protein